jgi:hypothetical protein
MNRRFTTAALPAGAEADLPIIFIMEGAAFLTMTLNHATEAAACGGKIAMNDVPIEETEAAAARALALQARVAFLATLINWLFSCGERVKTAGQNPLREGG